MADVQHPAPVFPAPFRELLIATFGTELAESAAKAIRAGEAETAVRQLVDLLLGKLDAEMVEIISDVRAGFDRELGKLLRTDNDAVKRRT